LNIQSTQVAALTIFNVTGEMVLNTIVEQNGSVNIECLKPGLYFVDIRAGEYQRRFKLLKQ
jgi:hypothetical protein